MPVRPQIVPCLSTGLSAQSDAEPARASLALSLCVAAEAELTAAKVRPECVLTVLQLLSQETVDLSIRQAASVFFKNLVEAHWAPEDETAYTIPEATKTQCKDGLLSLFLVVPPKLQAQLSAAMSRIASKDFPERWPTLLGQLVSQLGAAASATPRDYAKVGGLLAIFHSITSRYRHEFKSDTLYAEIQTVLVAFQEPLLQLAQLAASELPAATAAGKAAAVPLLSALTTLAKLFHDLTAQDLPAYFEDHLAEWMVIVPDCETIATGWYLIAPRWLLMVPDGTRSPRIAGHLHRAAPVLKRGDCGGDR